MTMSSFDRMWESLRLVGRDPTTRGYRRFAWTREDHTLREWFAGECAARGMEVVVDRAGNQWGWWGDPDATPGVVIGSHLDSVADGTPLAAEKLARVLTNDPGMGVIRHVDAGYPEAEAVAAARGVRIPMHEH